MQVIWYICVICIYIICISGVIFLYIWLSDDGLKPCWVGVLSADEVAIVSVNDLAINLMMIMQALVVVVERWNR